ncbi:hypothetical protein FSP39_011716 [Pinctada imbricata]|uniref:Gamma-glutamylcyclotransferase family protein n=1 Tax=Pinctada imbricata TaxID=66713 RepID=A0AA88YR08_PINIB|nr:hypothetical protein FSP39_011716 [Pinctada imbricata]
MHHVFVYGTLKKGQPNYKTFESVNNGVKLFLGEGETKDKYPLVIASRYNIPFLLDAKNAEGSKTIKGEIYKVDDAVLDRLDQLEAHPELYQRVKIPTLVHGEDDVKGTPSDCWCYMLQEFKPELLELSFLNSYDANGPHGLKYMSRDQRAKDEPREHFWHDVKTTWKSPWSNTNDPSSCHRRVFMYGTLKREQPNHYFLLMETKGTAYFVGSGVTMETYPLVIGTKYNLPCLLNITDKGKKVFGDVYLVDEKKFEHLDDFEDHPDMYKREEIIVERTTDKYGRTITPSIQESAWCYFFREYDDSFLKKEFWDNYDTNGPHKQQYDVTEAESACDIQEPTE